MVGIINITKGCNLACKYCYAGNYTSLAEQRRTVDAELQKNMSNVFCFIDKLSDYQQGKVDILFHGGEPTLASPELLREIALYARKIDNNAKISIQTNGTLISDKLIDIFKEFHMTVGISIDGPPEVNDKNRIFSNGDGTADLIIRNIKKLQGEKVPVGGLITFTNENVEYAEKIYLMFRDLGIGFSFNPLFIPETEVGVSQLEQRKYAKAICEMFDLWINDQGSNIGIRPFERILTGMVDHEVGLPVCSYSQNCAEDILTLDVDGQVYSCNRLAGMKEFSYGYITDININEKISNCIFANRWDYLKENDCKDCKISMLCYGGCPSHSHAKKGTIYCKDDMCGSHLEIINHIYNYIQGFRK